MPIHPSPPPQQQQQIHSSYINEIMLLENLKLAEDSNLRLTYEDVCEAFHLKIQSSHLLGQLFEENIENTNTLFVSRMIMEMISQDKRSSNINKLMNEWTCLFLDMTLKEKNGNRNKQTAITSSPLTNTSNKLTQSGLVSLSSPVTPHIHQPPPFEVKLVDVLHDDTIIKMIRETWIDCKCPSNDIFLMRFLKPRKRGRASDSVRLNTPNKVNLLKKAYVPSLKKGCNPKDFYQFLNWFRIEDELEELEDHEEEGGIEDENHNNKRERSIIIEENEDSFSNLNLTYDNVPLYKKKRTITDQPESVDDVLERNKARESKIVDDFHNDTKKMIDFEKLPEQYKMYVQYLDFIYKQLDKPNNYAYYMQKLKDIMTYLVKSSVSQQLEDELGGGGGDDNMDVLPTVKGSSSTSSKSTTTSAQSGNSLIPKEHICTYKWPMLGLFKSVLTMESCRIDELRLFNTKGRIYFCSYSGHQIMDNDDIYHIRIIKYDPHRFERWYMGPKILPNREFEDPELLNSCESYFMKKNVVSLAGIFFKDFSNEYKENQNMIPKSSRGGEVDQHEIENDSSTSDIPLRTKSMDDRVAQHSLKEVDIYHSTSFIKSKKPLSKKRSYSATTAKRVKKPSTEEEKYGASESRRPDKRRKSSDVIPKPTSLAVVPEDVAVSSNTITLPKKGGTQPLKSLPNVEEKNVRKQEVDKPKDKKNKKNKKDSHKKEKKSKKKKNKKDREAGNKDKKEKRKSRSKAVESSPIILKPENTTPIITENINQDELVSILKDIPITVQERDRISEVFISSSKGIAYDLRTNIEAMIRENYSMTYGGNVLVYKNERARVDGIIKRMNLIYNPDITDIIYDLIECYSPYFEGEMKDTDLHNNFVHYVFRNIVYFLKLLNDYEVFQPEDVGSHFMMHVLDLSTRIDTDLLENPLDNHFIYFYENFRDHLPSKCQIFQCFILLFMAVYEANSYHTQVTPKMNRLEEDDREAELQSKLEEVVASRERFRLAMEMCTKVGNGQ